MRLLWQETVRLFAEGLRVLFLIPTSKVCVSSSCSHPHRQLLLSDCLILTFVTGVLAMSHWGFHLHFPDGEPGWVSLRGCISRQCMLSEEEFLFPTGLVSNSWVLQALCMFPEKSPFIWYMICKDFLPVCSLLFHPLNRGLLQSKSVLVWWNPVYFSL